MSRPPSVLAFAGTAGGILLGGVLLFAAVVKALDPVAFGEQLVAEGLTFGMPTGLAVGLALGVEAVLGLALLLGLRRLAVLLPAAGLVFFFVALTGRSWWRVAHGLVDEATAASCGCFGNLVQRSPAEAFWQDLLLLVPPLLLSFVARPSGSSARRRLIALAVGVAAIVGLSVAAPRLPLDNLVTRLSPGTELAETCAGEDPRVCFTDLIPELAEGSHWVVLADLGALTAQVPAFNAYAAEPDADRLWVVVSASPAELSTFVWENGPAFDLREAPLPLLRPLFRSLPRSFLVRDGLVLDTTDDWPPGLAGGASRTASATFDSAFAEQASGPGMETTK